MATKLASLVIKLGADSAELNTELAKSKKSANKWKKDMDKVGKSASIALRNVSIAATAATAGLTAMYAVNARNLDALGKTASRLGVTASELDRFGKAAEFSGVEANQAFGAIQEMTKRLGEAANGAGEAAKALDKIGLSVSDLRNLNPTQIFDLIIDKTDELNQQDKLFVFDKLFGGSGVGLANVTKEANDRSKELNATLDKLFGTLDTRAVEAANDDFAELSAITKRAQQQLTIALAPAVSGIAKSVVEAAEEFGGLDTVIDNAVRSALDGAISVTEAATNVLDFLDKRDGMVEFGVHGYLLLGKKGALLGAVAGTLGLEAFKVFDEAKTLLSDSSTEIEKLNVQITKNEKLLNSRKPSRILISDDEYFGSIQNQLDDLIVRRDILLSGQPESGQDSKPLGTVETEAGFLLGTLYNIRAELDAINSNPITGAVDSAIASGGTTENPQQNIIDLELQAFNTRLMHRKAFANEEARIVAEAAAAQEAAEKAKQQNIITGLQSLGSVFSSFARGTDTRNKKEFEKQQDFNRAAAIANTAAGITAAFRNSVSPFGWVPEVSAIAASGLAQLVTINRTKYKGGGTAASVSANTSGGISDSSPSVGASDIDTTGSDSDLGRATNVYILNGMFAKTDTQEVVGDAIKNLNDQGVISVTDGELDTRNVVEIAV